MICRSTIAALFAAALVMLGVSATVVLAQEDPAGASFITPFPEGDVYKLQVVGDSLAEGALSGLVEAFGSDSRLQINRKVRSLSGVTRNEADDELRALEDTLTRESAHITVVMLGRDDRMSFRSASNRRLEAGSDGWREEYARRIDRLMKVLKRRGGAVYWIGLPVVQRRDWNEIVQLANDVMRDRAYVNGLRFIDAYAGFADENGSFVALGPDAGGLVRKLREGDGVSFTAAGNRKLAHFVEREIRRDLNQAKAERAIPLAGADVEQKRIRPEKAAAAAAVAMAKPGDARASWQASTVPAPASASSGSGQNDQKADNSRVTLRVAGQSGREETLTLDILRPAIPASVIQLVARSASPDKAAQVGDTLPDLLAGGTVVLSSVSPIGNSGPGRRPKLAPTQTPYFRVMVKGEQLPPRAGRADDFRWPRASQAGDDTGEAGAGARAAPAAVRAPTSQPGRIAPAVKQP